MHVTGLCAALLRIVLLPGRGLPLEDPHLAFPWLLWVDSLLW